MRQPPGVSAVGVLTIWTQASMLSRAWRQVTTGGAGPGGVGTR